MPDESGKNNFQNFTATVCVGRCCAEQREGLEIFERLRNKLHTLPIKRREFIRLRKQKCFGICRSGVIVHVDPGDVWYYHVSGAIADRIFDEHLLGGRRVFYEKNHDRDIDALLGEVF
ncbi:MAG: (2Fe-2S) ferredoxin domain-containing protein [Parcubacteria group bacterium]|nr:(2Fe-2S) ferredoxin domain-containing protein [Parcubacteria group bacterium]